MKYFYTYKLINEETTNFYYGSRVSDVEPELDPYMGSPTYWKKQSDFDESNLTKIILETFNDFDTMRMAEQKLIQEWIKHPKNQNAHIPNKSFGFYGKPRTEESNKKTSESLRKWHLNNEVPPVSDETRAKISKTKKGTPPWNKGVKMSAEFGAKMSEVQKGRVQSEEMKNKRKESLAITYSNKIECPNCGKLLCAVRMKRHLKSCN